MTSNDIINKLDIYLDKKEKDKITYLKQINSKNLNSTIKYLKDVINKLNLNEKEYINKLNAVLNYIDISFLIKLANMSFNTNKNYCKKKQVKILIDNLIDEYVKK